MTFVSPDMIREDMEKQTSPLDQYDSIEAVLAAVDAGEISMEMAQLIMQYMPEEQDPFEAGLGLAEDLFTAAPPQFPSSLPTTVMRGSSGSGTSALRRLGIGSLV